MNLRCACGHSAANYKDLRVHIALQTEGWPRDRCSVEHFDPHSHADLRSLFNTKIWEGINARASNT